MTRPSRRQRWITTSSTYRAGAGVSGWDLAGLTSAWCPTTPDLDAILAGVEPAGDSTGVGALDTLA
jgi:hypothetical protein